MYDPQHFRKWLAFLAKNLVKKETTLFLIEYMQPDWLWIQNGFQGSKNIMIRWLWKLLGNGEIEIKDNQWSWGATLQEIKKSVLVWPFLGLVLWLGFVLYFWLSNLLYFWLFGWPIQILNTELAVNGLFWGLFLGFVVGISLSLFVGFERGSIRSHEKPNQGIWLAFLKGIIFVLIGGLVGGLFGGFALEVLGWAGGVFIGTLYFGVFFGLRVGLAVFIRHFALRGILAHYEYLPWKLVPFLEFAKERLFLRRVGGGYIFIHRTLMEYFANQE